MKKEKTPTKTPLFDYKTIKSYEDAVKALPVHKNDTINPDDALYDVALKKLRHIIKVINNGWIPDWDNYSQKKWYPWFRLSSGFGFLVSVCGYGYSGTGVGSRLCFENEEKSTFTANQFLKLYEEYLK
jgi:hypothetical protein